MNPLNRTLPQYIQFDAASRLSSASSSSITPISALGSSRATSPPLMTTSHLDEGRETRWADVQAVWGGCEVRPSSDIQMRVNNESMYSIHLVSGSSVTAAISSGMFILVHLHDTHIGQHPILTYSLIFKIHLDVCNLEQWPGESWVVHLI